MQKLLATLSLIILLAPLSASAATLSDIETQLRFLLGQLAFLQSEASKQPLVCQLVASRSSVKEGEPFELIWNTYGANAPTGEGQSQFAQTGIETITVGKTGTFKYDMTFFGQGSAQTTCSAKITVTS